MTKPKDSVYSRHEEIKREIDRYEWKHSWHLPHDKHGYTDWFSQKTRDECRRVLQDHLSSAVQQAAICERLLREIEWNPPQEPDEE